MVLRRYGQGPALLLIHGFPLHGFTWRKLLPELSRHFTCHVVDLAGKGDSEWNTDTDFGFDAHARRLRQMIGEIGLNEYSLLGHDTGGTVARRLALAYPHGIRRLALINTEIPNHRPPWIPFYGYLFRLPGVAFALRYPFSLRAFVRSPMGLGGCFHDLRALEGEFHEHFLAPAIHSPRRMEGLVKYLLGINWGVVDALAVGHQQLTMPTLLIWGEDDPTFPISRAKELLQQLPNCHGLVPIPRTKLFPHEERPEAVLSPLLKFLSAGD